MSLAHYSNMCFQYFFIGFISEILSTFHTFNTFWFFRFRHWLFSSGLMNLYKICENPDLIDIDNKN